MNRFFSSVLLLVGLCLGVAHSFNAGLYPNSTQVLPHDYTIYWRADVANNTIDLAFKVKTSGWVCFKKTNKPE